MNNEKLFWSLFQANSETEVEKIVRETSLLSNPDNWKPYNGSKGNFGTFENQQNNPIPALIEKITNSIDAILIKNCKVNGIDPESQEAPKSMKHAVERFYEVPGGEIQKLTESERRELAENIQIIAEGDKKTPSITIYDHGEGQLPEKFEKTFLSLHTNNKTNIHFVQGKYNMGSTGAVVFCGENKYQLIASKKCPEIEHSDELGFTLVRRHQLSPEEEKHHKTTWYEYFYPKGCIPSFSSSDIDVGLYNRGFDYGTLVKLYSYELPRGARSDLTLDLWRELNQYMYNTPLPILVYEKRDYSGKSETKPVLGNYVRLSIDDRDKLEKEITIKILGGKDFGEIPVQVYVFKNGVAHKDFINHRTVIFTQNGQVHASYGQSFVSQELGLSLIKKHTLIQIDCTEIPASTRQDLFMANRTQLKEGSKTQKLEDLVVEALRSNDALKRINNERKNSLLRSNDNDERLIEDMLSKLPVDEDVIRLLDKDGSLDFLKTAGKRFKSDHKEIERPSLNRFPSLFKLNLKRDGSGKKYKTVPLNNKGYVEIETDVEDNYLYRPTDKGNLKIEILKKINTSDKPVTPSPVPPANDLSDIIDVTSVGPDDGTIKLIVKPTEKAKVGDRIEVKATLTSPGKDHSCLFHVKVDKEISKPRSSNNNQRKTFPKLPKPQKAFKSPLNSEDLSWDNELLNWTGEDTVKVITGPAKESLSVEGIIVNMDSFVLQKFLSKNSIKSEKEIVYQKDKYFLSIYLHSLFLFSILQKMRKENDDLKPLEIDEFISSMIKPYSNFLMYENYHITQHAFDD